MKKKENKGVLYLVSTPIGNLKDITIRALETLRDVDFVAVEDMKRAKKLLSAYNIKGRIIGYREENRERAAKTITGYIDEGKNVALISDAGTPALSDPGDHLIKRCIEKGITVVPIPGASSIICALTVSGLNISEFTFLGFLDRKGKKRGEQLSNLAVNRRTSVIFESPKRIVKTLTDILDVVGDRDAVICRELTKLHEEVIRGSVLEIIGELKEREEIKGEVVLIVSGGEDPKDNLDRDVVVDRVKKYVQENPGKKTKEVAKVLGAELGVSVREIYEITVKEREN